MVSCPKTDRKTRTVVPPLEHFSTSDFSNSNADDEDDFEALAGTFFCLTVSTVALTHFLFMQHLHNLLVLYT